MVQELDRVRNKYPQYSDMDDMTLAQKLADKYPAYSDLPGKVSGGVSPGRTMREAVPIEGELKTAPPRWVGSVGTGVEMAGLLGGGLIGGGAGLLGGPAAPATSPLGAIAGAGLGRAGAMGAYDKALELMGITKPRGLRETSRLAVERGLGGAAMEAGGPFVTKGISKVIAPFAKYLKTPVGAELVSIYKQYGIKPLPGELKPGAKTFGIIESVLGYRPLSGDVMVKRALQNVEKLNIAREQLIAKGAPRETVELVGKRIKDEVTTILERHGAAKMGKLNTMVDDAMKSITGGRAAVGKYEAGVQFSTAMEQGKIRVDKIVKESYQKLSEGLPGRGNAPLPQTATQKVAGEIFEEESRANLPLARVQKTTGRFIPKGAEAEGGLGEQFGEQFGISKRMLEKDPELAKMVTERTQRKAATWNSMDHDQSVLGDKIAQLKQATGGKETRETRQLGRLKSAILDDMEDYAKSVGGNAWKQYQHSKMLSKTYHDIFDKDILRIMNKHPEDIVDSILKKGKDSVTYLRQINMATGQGGIEPLRQVSGRRMFETSRTGDVIDVTKLRKNWNSIPTDTRSMLFDKRQSALIEKVINTGESIKLQIKGAKTVEFLETLAGTSNHKIVAGIVQAETGHNAGLARRLLSPKRLSEVQSISIEKILKVSPVEGKVMTVQSAKDFQKYNASLLEIMKTPQGAISQRYRDLQSFLKGAVGMKRAEQLAMNASQTGQVLLGSQVGSSIIKSLASGTVGGVARVAGMAGLPWAVAKIYTSDMASRYFTRAVGLNPASKQAIELFIKAIAVVATQEEYEGTKE